MVVLEFHFVQVKNLLGANLGLFGHHWIGQWIHHHEDFGPGIGKTTQPIVDGLGVITVGDRGKAIIGGDLGQKNLPGTYGSAASSLGVPKNELALYRGGIQSGYFA